MGDEWMFGQGGDFAANGGNFHSCTVKPLEIGEWKSGCIEVIGVN